MRKPKSLKTNAVFTLRVDDRDVTFDINVSKESAGVIGDAEAWLCVLKRLFETYFADAEHSAAQVFDIYSQNFYHSEKSKIPVQ